MHPPTREPIMMTAPCLRLAPRRPLRSACCVLLPLLAALWLAAYAVSADRGPGAPAAPIAADIAHPDIANLYDRTWPAVVEVLVNDHLNGTGWIADRAGYVITAAHVVVGDQRRIEVLIDGIGRTDAKLLAVDLGRDLALLTLPAREGGYPFLPAAKATPAAGSEIYLFGSPIYRHRIMLKGAVARTGASFEYLPDQRSYIETIHVAADTPRGTSGGPWVNAAGQFIGLQSGMMRDQNAQVGIAFVIPLEPIRDLLESKTSTSTATLGIAIEEIWEQTFDYLKKFPPRTEGLVVRQPDADGPAAKAGIVELDVIVAVNGQPVRLRDQLMRIIRAAAPGDELTLKTLRLGVEEPRIVKVKLAKMEKN